ncbi:hypothetical protein BGX24_005164 [Mortierella sp. AD032]|nr:hypothetical protein BGX24_005164 [Mortierella sp. AD032]
MFILCIRLESGGLTGPDYDGDDEDDDTDDYSGDRWIELLIALIKRNPSLQKICVMMERFEPTTEFWESIGQASATSGPTTTEARGRGGGSGSLKSLECVSMFNDKEVMEGMRRHFGTLKDLEFGQVRSHCILWMYENGVSHHGLDFTLEAGLDQLAGLKKLEELNLEGIYQRMGEKDVKWMLEHWPRLRVVEGELHYRREERVKLDILMEQRGFKILNHSYRK